MKRRVSVTTVLATVVLTLAACGDDGDEATITGATDGTGASTASGIATAGEFVDASTADQVRAVEEEAKAASECQGVDTKAGGQFQTDVAIDAASAPEDTSLAEIVGGQCAEN